VAGHGARLERAPCGLMTMSIESTTLVELLAAIVGDEAEAVRSYARRPRSPGRASPTSVS
jgi:hypothetical protein